MNTRGLAARAPLAVLCALASVGADAQVMNWGEEYAKRIKATEQVSPLTDDVFGDQVNLFNGTVSFKATDIAIPGNNALPVQLSRSHSPQNLTSDLALGDWDLDVPRIEGVHPAGSPWAPAQRCSTVAPPPDVTAGGYNFLAQDYWSGNSIHSPSGGGELLGIANDPKLVRPTGGDAYRWVTKDGWFVSCLSSLKSGHAGEGFLAHAPDGTKYTFDWMVTRPYPMITKKDPSRLETGVVSRVSARLYATRVEDRFGNRVIYQWTGDRLTRIRAESDHSDEVREITLEYNATGDRLQSATANGRTWQYQYEGYGLSSVINPDGSRWHYQHGGTGSTNRIDYVPDLKADPGGRVLKRDDEHYCWPTNVMEQQRPTYSITHPAGATAQFTFGPVRHGRTNVPFVCLSGTDDDWRTDYNKTSLTHEVMSLLSKRISGPGLQAWQYDYTYEDLAGGYRPRNAHDDEVNGATPPPHYKTVTMARPDGSRTVNTFGKDYDLNEGQLIQTEVVSAQGHVVRTTSNLYVTEAEALAAAFPARVGSSFVWSGDPLASAHRPLRMTTITQESTDFSTETEAFDAHGRSTHVRQSSSLGFSKAEQKTFHDDLEEWVLGQTASVADVETGKVVSSTVFDTRSLPWKLSQFGKLQHTLTYRPDGTLASVTDANANVTQLGNWSRGIPQLITYMDGTSKAATVNGDGTIASITDENGDTTAYAYDAMGRLTEIDFPGAWASTQLGFTRVEAAEFGIPAGHWRHLVSTGDGRKYTYFDGLWRPLVTHEYDAASPATTERFQRSAYDYAGRTVFSSYPAAEATASSGTRTSYDALGRVEQSTQDSEIGPLTTTTEYLPGFLMRVTNPRGHSTTTHYQAFGEPDTSAPVLIRAPEGITTQIDRDDFGKTEALIRSGSTD